MTRKHTIGLIFLIVAAIIGGLVFWPTDSGKLSSRPATSKGRYIALGDSVAAGVGLKDYSDSSACDRTKQAYPNQVAANLSYQLQSVACSGAATQAGLVGPQDVNKLTVAPQLDALLAATKPSLVSLTIGANDADWTTFIQKCYTDVCGSSNDTGLVNADLATASTNLEQTLTRLKNKYPSATPAVILTGYYRLFPAAPANNCTELSGIDPAELTWIQQLQDSIDSSLQAVAAKFKFVTFAPINFSNHELCTKDPWIQGLSSKAPYHPTAAGQTAIANQILKAVAATRPTQ